MKPALVWVHVTAYRDPVALRAVCASVVRQTLRPSLLRIFDNSPSRLPLPDCNPVSVEHVSALENIGTAGAINRSIREALGRGAQFLWILDQDSKPAPCLLAALIESHRTLCASGSDIAIVAPLTRNRDDGSVNLPLTFDGRALRRLVPGGEPIRGECIPAAGMLLHLPSLTSVELPSDRYFLDIYDFALGLAVRAAGAEVWVMPGLELSHQIGKKILVRGLRGPRLLADMPVHRVRLCQQNLTYLLTRRAVGLRRIEVAIRLLWLSAKRGASFASHDFENRWAKAVAALGGWACGLFRLPPSVSRR